MSALVIVALCAIAVGLFFANVASLLMIAELDRTRDERSLDAKFAFTRRAGLPEFREYRKTYPAGKLHIYTLAGLALAIIGFIGLALFIIRAYQPLVVRITSPGEGAAFTAPADIVISADATEGPHTVSRVDFYQGRTLIGSSTTAPFSVTWTNVPTGSYLLTATATDYRGTTMTAKGVSITVNATSNRDP
jgi:hypothetical protein